MDYKNSAFTTGFTYFYFAKDIFYKDIFEMYYKINLFGSH
jgi:hypothetical protein